MGADGQGDRDDPIADTLAAGGRTASLHVADTLESGRTDDTAPTGPSSGAPPAIAAGTIIDRYVVTGELGRGGMGIVLAADDPDLHRQVAIKLLRARDAPVSHAMRQRLVREGQAIAQLSHPNVVQIYDVGMHGAEVFIAMEMVAGMSLARWLGTRRSHREILGVFVQAGRGLVAAHAKQIVHRDFKPDNVRVGDDGRVRVLDFGLARAVAGVAPATTAGSALTQTMTVEGSIMGTPAYMAPEQFVGDTAGELSDQFSYCVALHEALCGQRPFDGATFDELAGNVSAGRRRPMPRRARVPARIEKLVARGLATDPGDRHPSFAGLVDALDRERSRSRARWLIAGGVAAVAIAAPIAIVVATEKREALDDPRRPRPPRPEPVLRQIVREAGVHLHPSFLPDGAHFVHTNGSDVVLRAIGGAVVRNLTASFDPPATESEVSPDGTQVAFSAGGGLYTVAIAGGEPTRVGDGYWPTWSPDGRRLAYVTSDLYDIFSRVDARPGGLWIVDLATGVRSEILRAGDHSIKQPDWSPDGARFAFIDDNHLKTCAADGSDVRPTEIRSAWHPVWAPDGKGIYVARERGGRYEIAWLAWDPARNTGPSAESYPAASLAATPLWHFDVARDGRRFLGAVFQADRRTIRIGFDPATGRAIGLPQPITDPYHGLISPAVSPDGKTIAYTSLTEIDEQIYVTDASGGNGRAVIIGNEYRRAPVWRPDGSAITYHGSVDNEWGIHEVALDGTPARTLALGEQRLPHWSPDGKRLAVSAVVDGSNFPYIVDVDRDWYEQGKAQHREERRGWRTGAWSLDGRSIAVISERGIGVMDATTLAIEPRFPRGNDAVWLADGRMIVADRSELVVVARDGTATPLTSLAPAHVTDLPSLDASPSRDAIYVSVAIEHASLWLAELK